MRDWNVAGRMDISGSDIDDHMKLHSGDSCSYQAGYAHTTERQF